MEEIPQLLETLEGSVYSIRYYNEETSYCVMTIELPPVTEGAAISRVVIVGTMPEMQVGEAVRIKGAWTHDPRYGRQFKAYTVQQILPVTIDGIVRYLGSGLIKGIGSQTAQKIVDHFGLETLKVLDSSDAFDQLTSIGISKRRAKLIVDAWSDQREVAEVMMFLQQYGIGTATAIKIYRFYKDDDRSAIQILQQNPYQLMYDIHGIGFKKADQIALNTGIPADSPDRMRAALFYVLNESIDEGHVFLPQGMLFDRAMERLGIEQIDPLADALAWLNANNYIVQQYLDDLQVNAIYKTALYRAEEAVAKKMVELSATPGLWTFQQMQASDIDFLIQSLAKQADLTLTPQQQQAVHIALTHPVSILTGGPGTGKTTTLRTLITALKATGYDFKLASPTGRAAKRLSQATLHPASTIHRMLGYNPDEGFSYGATEPLDTQFVIIDEASMLDIRLFHALLQAIEPGTHLLLVGDVDQLPSVGPGDVLRDLIRSQICPVTRLNVIFRQEEGSRIILNAHRINRGEQPILDNQGHDFFFFGKEAPQEAAELLVDIVKNRIPEKFGYDPINDIQVLSPMYRTPIGVDELNIALQEQLNPPGNRAEQRFGKRLYRVGDKVIQTRNNYEKNVFNGDIGTIHSFDFEKKTIQVLIDGNAVEYSWYDMDELSLAYACTVHRAQGSEYPVVVFPVVTQHFMMLQRNLLYTAVTRAQKMVVLVGTRQAISIAVKNDQIAKRWSALDWRLIRLLDGI